MRAAGWGTWLVLWASACYESRSQRTDAGRGPEDTPAERDAAADDRVDATAPSCDCTPGAYRYCEFLAFPVWGRQECTERPEAPSWGSCLETDIPDGCEPGGWAAADFEWRYRGGYWEDVYERFDEDGDGVIILRPDGLFHADAEDCAIRQGLCTVDLWDLDRDLDIQESLGDCLPLDTCDGPPAPECCDG